MKKLFALLLALVMVLSLAACGGGDEKTPSNDDKTSGSIGQQEQNTPDPVEDEPDEDACTLCGFCPVPLGLCIFIWIAIVIIVILVIVIVIVIAIATGKKKCPNCKTKYRKGEKFCAKCGHKLK